jgi:hypothetical protein
LSEWNADLLLDVLVDNIEQLTELVNCKLEKPLSSNALVYCDEKMNSFIKSEKPKPIAMDDLFKLAESCVNNIAVAA